MQCYLCFNHSIIVIPKIILNVSMAFMWLELHTYELMLLSAAFFGVCLACFLLVMSVNGEERFGCFLTFTLQDIQHFSYSCSWPQLTQHFFTVITGEHFLAYKDLYQRVNPSFQFIYKGNSQDSNCCQRKITVTLFNHNSSETCSSTTLKKSSYDLLIAAVNVVVKVTSSCNLQAYCLQELRSAMQNPKRGSVFLFHKIYTDN